MRVISALIAMTVLSVSAVWVQESTSEIDPESLMGMWNFDHGQGRQLKTFHQTGTMEKSLMPSGSKAMKVWASNLMEAIMSSFQRARRQMISSTDSHIYSGSNRWGTLPVRTSDS